MLKIFIQYILILNKIRKSKQRGYKGVQINKIYPINAEKLRNKGYRVITPSIFTINWVVRWDG